MITVPDQFAVSTIAREGDAGRAWIGMLPGLVHTLCREWDLEVDGTPMHGYLGLVVPVRRGAEPCVLKVSWPDESSVDEAAALAAWNGQGAVRLLHVDPARGAMLLERLDWSRSLEDVAIGEALTIAGRLLRRLAVPAPDGLRRLSDTAEQLAQELPDRWERCGRPMPRSWLERACAVASELGPSSAALLTNYDLHYTDVLASRREPWLAVDPKVVAGDVEYGLAQLLWCRLEDIEAAGGLAYHMRLLVDAAAVDPALAHGWTVVRCVDYWLWALSAGLTYDPARCERIVEWLMSIDA